MTFWICAGISLAAAAAATFVGDIRRAILALWVAGLGVGGLYLSLGAELLAVIQWIVSTLVSISFVFYAVMFGEYGVPDRRTISEKAVSCLSSLGLGAAFAGVIVLGGRDLPGMMGAELLVRPVANPGVMTLGRALADDYFLSLEILALTLFLVIVGSGVVARPEVRDT